MPELNNVIEIPTSVRSAAAEEAASALELSEVAASASSTPELTPEQYTEIMELRNRQANLKQSSYDLGRDIERVEGQIRDAQEQLNGARTRRANLDAEVDSVTTSLQEKYNEYIAPFGFSGPVTIADKAPHTLTSTPEN